MKKYSNIIINGFHDSRFTQFLESIVNSLGVKNCYYLSDNNNIVIRGCNTKIIDLQKITKGFYDRSLDSLLPLDSNLLSSLRECEILCLRMMDRIEFNCDLSYKERKLIYLNHVRYWNTILEEDSISLFIANNMPHEIYDYIIYSLCKIKNIKTFFFHQSLTIPDSIFLINDLKESTIDIKIEYNKLCTNNQNIELDKNYLDYWNQQTLEGSNPTPFYMKSNSFRFKEILLKFKHLFIKIFKSIFSDLFLRKVSNFFSLRNISKIKIINRLKKDTKKLDKRYRKLSIDKPDLTKKYVYVPLHYQPELTTCPLADEYVDQLLMVHLISKSISSDTFIYVKEHPKQTALGRDYSFYDDLSRISSVRLVSKFFSSYDLMKHSIAVATCTGTAGWEALFRQKPVLMFGNFFYQYADAVYRIKNYDECKKACSLIDQGSKPDSAKMKLFLQAVQNCTIRAVCDPVYWAISTISVEESNNNMHNALLKKLK